MLRCLTYSPLAATVMAVLLCSFFFQCECSKNLDYKISNDTKSEENENFSPPLPAVDAAKSGRKSKDMGKRELTVGNIKNVNVNKKVVNAPGQGRNRGNNDNRRQPTMPSIGGHHNQRPGPPGRNPHQNGRQPPMNNRNRRPDQNGCRGKYIHRIIVRNKFPCGNPHMMNMNHNQPFDPHMNSNVNPSINRQPYYYN